MFPEERPMNKYFNVAHNVWLLFLLVAGTSGLATAQDNTYDPEARLKELGIVLPAAPQPGANYVNGVRTGNLIFLAGKGPKRADGSEIAACDSLYVMTLQDGRWGIKGRSSFAP